MERRPADFKIFAEKAAEKGRLAKKMPAIAGHPGFSKTKVCFIASGAAHNFGHIKTGAKSARFDFE
jgi:hypothetical protein